MSISYVCVQVCMLTHAIDDDDDDNDDDDLVKIYMVGKGS